MNSVQGWAVRDILKADQLTIDAYMDKAEIVRTDPLTYETKVISFSPKALFESEKAEDIPLQRMDQIVVGTQMRPPSVVFVEGEVRRPGYFTLETGEKLSSILKRAGGFTATAFPEGIVLVRESVREASAGRTQSLSCGGKTAAHGSIGCPCSGHHRDVAGRWRGGWAGGRTAGAQSAPPTA